MFGGLQLPCKPELKSRPVPKIVDVTGINMVAHMAPDPGSCYNYKMMQYGQRIKEFEEKKESANINNRHNDQMFVKYLKHFEKKEFTRVLNMRVDKKMAEYEEQIEIRREKLRNLFYVEEREFIKEVISSVQTAKENIFQERIQKLNNLKEQKIAERLEIAREYKRRQYLERCTEFRPVLITQRLRESKEIQLQQIQENEERKRHERELAQMWHEMVLKEMKAQLQREEREALDKQKVKEEMKYIHSMYIKEQDEKQEIRKHKINEEKKLLENLRAGIELENKAVHEEKMRKRNEIRKSINTQLKERKEILQHQANNELSITNVFYKLVEQELENERLAMKQKTVTGKQDMILYKQYLEELRQKQHEEKVQMNEIVYKSMLEIQQKQTDEKCNFEMARKALLENVLKERAEQIEFQRKQKEEQERLQKSETKWCMKTRELNEQLNKERERQKQLAGLKYGDELIKQIEYSKLCEERSKKELAEILEAAKIEEKLYNDIVSKTMERKTQTDGIHPFRRVMEEGKCHCPK